MLTWPIYFSSAVYVGVCVFQHHIRMFCLGVTANKANQTCHLNVKIAFIFLLVLQRYSVNIQFVFFSLLRKRVSLLYEVVLVLIP